MALTPAEARREIEERFTNPKAAEYKALHDDRDPGHRDAMRARDAVYRDAYPEDKQ